MIYKYKVKSIIFPAILFLFILAIINSCTIENGNEDAEIIDCNLGNVPNKINGTIKLFIMAGQSNMAGHGLIDSLPDNYRQFKNVHIYHAMSTTPDNPSNGQSKWKELTPGHGHRFEIYGSNIFTSDLFGPEIGFANNLSAKFPNDTICIIKYARGGSSLKYGISSTGSWLNENEGIANSQSLILLNTINNGIKELSTYLQLKEAVNIEKLGFIWLQGEADASYNEESAKEYGDRFSYFHTQLAQNLSDYELINVLVPLTDSKQDSTDGLVMDHINFINDWQCEISGVSNFCLTRTDSEIRFVDLWHYTSDSYLAVGHAIGDCFY